MVEQGQPPYFYSFDFNSCFLFFSIVSCSYDLLNLICEIECILAKYDELKVEKLELKFKDIGTQSMQSELFCLPFVFFER